MEPAIYQLKMSNAKALAYLGALTGRLAREDSPQVPAVVDGDRVLFRCDTWRPILVSRITDALAAEMGADQDLFGPL